MADVVSNSALDLVYEALRQEHRIKRNTDYAVVVKYGKVHVLCGAVYEETIRDVFLAHNAPLTTLTTHP